MNWSALAGLILVSFSVYYGAILGLPNPQAVFNLPSVVLVLGGTLAAFLMAFPFQNIQRIFHLVFIGLFRSKKNQKKELVRNIVSIAQDVYEGNHPSLQKKNFHSFLKEASILMLDKSLSDEDLEYVLRQRTMGFKREYSKDVKLLLAVAKFPPAFGLLGSVTGIIAMLMNLGKTGGKEVIGQGMAIALLTTFWGVAITNIFILPLSDFAQRLNKEDEELREIIVEGMLLIREKDSTMTITRKLRSLLSLEERKILMDVQKSTIIDHTPLDENTWKDHG